MNRISSRFAAFATSPSPIWRCQCVDCTVRDPTARDERARTTNTHTIERKVRAAHRCAAAGSIYKRAQEAEDRKEEIAVKSHYELQHTRSIKSSHRPVFFSGLFLNQNLRLNLTPNTDDYTAMRDGRLVSNLENPLGESPREGPRVSTSIKTMIHI